MSARANPPACRAKAIESLSRTIPHYPTRGVMFLDITTLLQAREGVMLPIAQTHLCSSMAAACQLKLTQRDALPPRDDRPDT